MTEFDMMDWYIKLNHSEYLILIENFLSVVLNGQSSSWAKVSAGVLPGSVLGALFFLIYISYLSCGLSSTTKLFAGNTSLFCGPWGQTDKSKQSQEVVFSRKTQTVIHPPAIFNNMPVVHSSCQRKV